MKKLLLLSLLLTGCAIHNLSNKYDTTISQMKQNLLKAQNSIEQQQEYIKRLEVEIAKQEIESIKREVAKVDTKKIAKQMLTNEQWSSFFFSQREILSEIIHNTPACRAEAQEVLDKILTLITQLSDDVALSE